MKCFVLLALLATCAFSIHSDDNMAEPRFLEVCFPPRLSNCLFSLLLPSPPTQLAWKGPSAGAPSPLPKHNFTRVGHQPLNRTLGHLGVLPMVTRADVMDCAYRWVKSQVPYCQCSGGPPSECCGNCPYCSSTRCDCSGFVSYCWGLRSGYTTWTLPQVSHQISKDQLQKGDVMLYVQDHVAFFGGWCDSTRTTFMAIQEPGCHTSGPHHAFSSCVQYPFNWNPQDFKPYAYNHIQ